MNEATEFKYGTLLDLYGTYEPTDDKARNGRDKIM